MRINAQINTFNMKAKKMTKAADLGDQQLGPAQRARFYIARGLALAQVGPESPGRPRAIRASVPELPIVAHSLTRI